MAGSGSFFLDISLLYRVTVLSLAKEGISAMKRREFNAAAIDRLAERANEAQEAFKRVQLYAFANALRGEQAFDEAALDGLVEHLKKSGPIEKTNRGWHCHGTLFLSGRTDVTALPDNLHVERALIINGTSISELPSGLIVDDAYLVDTDISEIPRDYECRGETWVDESKIRSCPTSLYGKVKIVDKPAP